MADNNRKKTSHSEVRRIFNDSYNVFYKKRKDISVPDQWVDLVQDMHEIDQRYNCDLCRQILLELVKVIENEFRNKDLKAM